MSQTLEDFAARQILAELARRRMPKSELARLLNKHQTWLGKKLANKRAMELNELAEIAAALDLPITHFLPPAEVAA